jgi:NAD-dependent deacetylase
MESRDSDYELIAERFLKSELTVVLTGAGVSAESGVPTFRDALTGLWKNFDPMQLATPEAFRADPDMVWKWYRHRRGLALKVEPNPGHHAIKEMEDLAKDFLLVTQNVDNLHQRAGSKKVVEFHGNIMRYRCFNDCVVMDDTDNEEPFKCEKCGDWIRPDVVWFGEAIPEKALRESMGSVGRCDLLFTIGTSGVVQPAASLPMMAKSNGAFVVEVNLQSTPVTPEVDVFLEGKSGEVMPVLVEKIRQAENQ